MRNIIFWNQFKRNEFLEKKINGDNKIILIENNIFP